jgi:hypothetical protein
MNKGIKLVKIPIVIFSDTNTNLGKQPIGRIVNLFSSPTAFFGIFITLFKMKGATKTFIHTPVIKMNKITT